MNALQEQTKRCIENVGGTVLTLHESCNCAVLLVVRADDFDVIERIAVNPAGKIIGRSKFRREPVEAKAVTPAKPSHHAREGDWKRSILRQELASFADASRAARK